MSKKANIGCIILARRTGASIDSNQPGTEVLCKSVYIQDLQEFRKDPLGLVKNQYVVSYSLSPDRRGR